MPRSSRAIQKKAMRGIIAGCLAVISVSACNSGPPMRHDCHKTICGCYEDFVMPAVLRLVDEDSGPVADAILTCVDTDRAMGRTDPSGVIRLRANGRTSPGCGFFADCEIAYFRMPDRTYGRPFWFQRLLRGDNVEPDGFRVELVAD